MPTAIAIPSRITIDFREDVAPSHAWIIGAMPKAGRQVEVLGVASVGSGRMASITTVSIAGAITSECCCPEFCELDHANE